MEDIFVSYRKADSQWAAGRISDSLELYFGRGKIFFDDIAIKPGDDFIDAIGSKMETCRVLLAVIGRNWFDHLLERRDDEDDFLRIEISEALKRGIRVVPILIDGTKMPSPKKLPAELKSLARRHASSVRAETFRADMKALSEILKEFLSSGSKESPPIADNAEHARVGDSKNIRLTHRTEYWKMGEDGKHRWRIFVKLKGRQSGDLDQIDRVVYYLNELFRNPVREIVDRNADFELKTAAWGGFEIVADVFFKEKPAPVRLRRHINL